MDNKKSTQDFFDQWDEYSQLVEQLDTYRFTEKALEGEIRGKVIDVGNGGVFNYDVRQTEEVVVVDLAKNLVGEIERIPQASFRYGDATQLPVGDGHFDTCLLQLVLHHLAEREHRATLQRTQQAISESFRVLKPGGRVVILESCLPMAWEIAERALYPLFRALLNGIKHPLVYQWNWNTLAGFVREAGFQDITLTEVRRGRWIILLGHKWPTALAPIRIYKITARKPAAA